MYAATRPEDSRSLSLLLDILIVRTHTPLSLLPVPAPYTVLILAPPNTECDRIR
jgi:hypothetical protein